MELLAPAVAGLAGLVFGWFAPAYQHLLYRQEEYRASPLAGSRLLRYRVGLALACGLIGGLAFRPDHYGTGPAVLSATFGLVLALVSSTDFERRIIPNRAIYPAIVAAAAVCWAWPDRSLAAIWIGAGVALAVGLGLFLLGVAVGAIMRVSATSFGFGDVKVILLTGLLVGWPGVTTALVLGVVAAGIPAAVLLFAHGARRTYSYGPYLGLGAAVVLLWPDRFA